MATAGVDFFRVDRSRSTKHQLIVAATLIAVGATSVGAHLVRWLPSEIALVVSLMGGALVLAGLGLGFGRMAMLLFENVYLLIREDGVLVHENGKDTIIPWADLDRVELEEASGFVVLERDGQELRWFAGRSAKKIASCVEDARRKALHGLLKVEVGEPA